MLQIVRALLLLLIAHFVRPPHTPVGFMPCVIARTDEIAETAAATAELYPVPPAVLLAVGMEESAFACDPRSGGSWGTPSDRNHRNRAGNSNTNGSALMFGYNQCRAQDSDNPRVWFRAISHFRCGRCSCPPLVGYEPIDALNLANRISSTPIR